ncbi:hypothetical protein MRB53_033096 [Persea americana]|uniref:Uncharacterized protein n=1 Tax=Persea americana TaxID=3435 RepID=A0ACC2KTI7_PERAE|nr:hypothetical protein MRB53_033096 [Persea americana]
MTNTHRLVEMVGITLTTFNSKWHNQRLCGRKKHEMLGSCDFCSLGCNYEEMHLPISGSLARTYGLRRWVLVSAIRFSGVALGGRWAIYGTNSPMSSMLERPDR